ncbi:hypothetical protein [Nannocystis bainbridge]|uniref:Uncharacterized protein n=1 Tax=Nannocystis bainbridge TaxID=2995303 RepID=A0ABT5DR59_9BACT|nr:hypothetical protein [Nannocystis bainbridge]MDC0716141.1 hypothetical protein [Nannocystis bainbridge]
MIPASVRNHLPLNRQRQQMAREGLEISISVRRPRSARCSSDRRPSPGPRPARRTRGRRATLDAVSQEQDQFADFMTVINAALILRVFHDVQIDS